MPFSSAEISGLVGNQTAMFSNQHSYAQQLSGLYGAGPQQAPAAMQPMTPSPSYAMPAMPLTGWGAHTGHMGSTVVGGMAQALPGMMGAASLAGGLIGGPLSVLDPFSMALKAGGMGFRAAGLGGGLAAGAAAALPYYAAYRGVEAVGQQMYAGAQNVADVGRMAGMYMGPQFGEAGARAGGAMGRQNIKGIVSVLEDIASQDVMVTVESAKKLMDKFGQMGLLQGIGDAQTFRNKFGGLVKQANEVAKILGTSLEEAAPLMGQFRSMGLWTARDVMGAAGAMRQVGAAAAPYMMGAMGAGAQMAHQMGGALGAGARIGQQAFMGVGTALRTGTLREEQIMEMTGGVGGLQGQQMVAQQMSGVMSQFSESAMGRLMMAGMGKFEGGRFTGGVDERTLARFQRGEISVAELQRIGQQRTRGSREAAVSWEVNRGRIGQEMMAQGGMEGMAQAVTQVMEKAGYGDAGEDIKNMFIQKMTGVDSRTADMIRRMGDDMPRIMAEKRRRAEAELNDRFRQVDERMNHSFQGLKDALGQASENFWRPVRDLGANMATEMSMQMDRANDVLLGRTRGVQFSDAARRRILAGGNLGETGADVTRSLAGTIGRTSFAEQIRSGGFAGLGAALTGGGAGTQAEFLRSLGAQTATLGQGGGNIEGFAEIGSRGQGDLVLAASSLALAPMTFGGSLAGLTQLGRDRQMVQAKDADRMVRAAMLRASTGRAEDLGLTRPGDTMNLKVVSDVLGRMGGSATSLSAFKKAKGLASQRYGEGEMAHAEALVSMLQSDPQAQKAIEQMREAHGIKAGSPEEKEFLMNMVRASSEGAGQKEGNMLRFDYEKQGGRASALLSALHSGSAEQMNAAANDLVASAEESTRDWGTGRIAATTAVGVGLAAVTMGASLVAAPLIEKFTGFFSGKAGRQEMLKQAAASGGQGFIEWLQSGGKENAWSTSNNEMAQKILEEFGGPEGLKKMATDMGGAAAGYGGALRTQVAQRGRAYGEEGLRGLGRVEGLGGGARGKVEAYLTALKEGKDLDKIQQLRGEAAGALTGKEDLSALGVAGEDLAAGGRLAGWGRKGSSAKTMSRLEQELGMPIPEEMRKTVEGMLKTGGGLDKQETDIIRAKMSEAWKRSEVQGGGTSDPQTKYMELNTRFVEVTGNAIAMIQGKDIEEYKKISNEMKNNTGPTTGARK